MHLFIGVIAHTIYEKACKPKKYEDVEENVSRQAGESIRRLILSSLVRSDDGRTKKGICAHTLSSRPLSNLKSLWGHSMAKHETFREAREKGNKQRENMVSLITRLIIYIFSYIVLSSIF